jgi:5-carboxymethyl-2-hydroxymuconate isomerase
MHYKGQAMAQIKIYGVREKLAPVRERLSEVIHECVMEALQFPADKRAHRFFLMDKENMLYPAGRTDAYTIIEISMIEGRSIEARKKLIGLLFDNIRDQVNIQHHDLEICIQESPACNWGFRGMHGDEVKLNYKIDV